MPSQTIAGRLSDGKARIARQRGSPLIPYFQLPSTTQLEGSLHRAAALQVRFVLQGEGGASPHAGEPLSTFTTIVALRRSADAAGEAPQKLPDCCRARHLCRNCAARLPPAGRPRTHQEAQPSAPLCCCPCCWLHFSSRASYMGTLRTAWQPAPAPLPSTVHSAMPSPTGTREKVTRSSAARKSLSSRRASVFLSVNSGSATLPYLHVMVGGGAWGVGATAAGGGWGSLQALSACACCRHNPTAGALTIPLTHQSTLSIAMTPPGRTSRSSCS